MEELGRSDVEIVGVRPDPTRRVKLQIVVGPLHGTGSGEVPSKVAGHGEPKAETEQNKILSFVPQSRIVRIAALKLGKPDSGGRLE